MFSMDDFNKDKDYYENFKSVDNLGEFPTYLMLVTHKLKEINLDETTKSGHELMMKIFNMTGLSLIDENEQALNVVMALISHIYAMIVFFENQDSYFEYFDNTVIYPMINGGKDI